jgi:hypothetical protein
MIHGLFLDPRTWKIDFQSSPFWNPQKYGVHIDLYPDAINIPKKGIGSKYKFVLATEVWEIPLRKSLEYMRKKGIKVFLIPREPFKTGVHKEGMFGYEKFLYNGEYYFTPDLILSPGQVYSDLWKDRATTVITGYPRWDFYIAKNKWRARAEIAKQYGLDPSKKVIFFPSYPPYYYKKVDGKDMMVDLYDVREETLSALEDFAKKNTEYQVVVKIHPMSFKCFRKGTGRGDEVSGLLRKYYESPTSHMKVIGDIRTSGLEAKELLIYADTVVGFTSTMLLEGALLNKPVIHVLFGRSGEIEGLPEYKDEMPTAYSAKELHTILAQSTTSGQYRMIYKYINQTSESVCKRICDAIKSSTG